jgi:propanediol utilization protein
MADLAFPTAAETLDRAPLESKVLILHQEWLRQIVRAAACAWEQADRARYPSIPIGVSARHVHLCPAEIEVLFGHDLTPQSWLGQPGQFACEERVTLVGPKGQIERVRVLGPARDQTQVEISRTDGFCLGLDAPLRLSGNLQNTPGLVLVGPAGQVRLAKGTIRAQRHIHMTPEDARLFEVSDGEQVGVRVQGDREVVFGDVVVRIDPGFRLEMHLDTDEANAADLSTGDVGHLAKSPATYPALGVRLPGLSYAS